MVWGCVRGGDCACMMGEGMQSSLAPDPEEEGLCHIHSAVPGRHFLEGLDFEQERSRANFKHL